MSSTLTVKEAQSQLPRLARGGELIAIQRRGKVCAFLVPREQFEEILETLELLAEPEAVKAIRDFEAGRVKPVPLKEAERRWK